MKISVIIPTVGRQTLKAVLGALFSSKKFDQIRPEIIVVFDGDISASYSGLDPESTTYQDLIKSWIPNKFWDDNRIKVLETGQKTYAAGARNFGLQHATGEVIVFIGDDTIPVNNWLHKLHAWHQSHPEPTAALLGHVAWVDRLAGDPFHQWLEQKALFDYARLEGGTKPTWRHFYTSNVSVKRALLGEEKFSTEFQGWGFEDSELGYRLAGHGMQLNYDGDLIVQHDDEQTLEGLISRTKQARANATVFERLHPEVHLLSRGWKKLLLQLTIIKWTPLKFIPRVKWWLGWKKAWLGKV